METWDATETAHRISTGDVSSTEVVQAALDRAAEWNPKVNALTHLDPERALATAREDLTGPFAGVPTFIKDLEDLAGAPSAYGSLAARPRTPRKSAATIVEVLNTGLIPLGKTTTSEYGLTGTVEPVDQEPTRNPHNLEHSSGGSSGGAAAMVASGVVPIAHGGDGGGSIRIPSSFCGLVGMKPSRGRLAPMAATKRMAIKIAQYGVLTRTVRDTANFYAAVEATAPSKTLPPIGKVAGPSSDKQRIGVFIDVPITSEIHPEIRQATEHAAKRLESMGHAVEWISPPADQGLADDFLLYWAFNAGLLELIVRLSPTARVGRLEPWTRGLAAHARSNMRHIRGAIGRLRAFEETYAALFNDLDVVLSPTTAGPAPKLGVISPDIDFEEGIQRLTQLLPYTPVQNVAGAPAINMPAGKTQDGLPIGVQLCAAQGQERKLLELAFALES